jgi:LmbE family N-acetylglucosaminyl deacetylase
VEPDVTPLLAAAARAPRRTTREVLAQRRSLAVVAPHPDDETLGCGALVHDAASAGVSCVVVCLTDGSASHRRSPSWPPERIAATRRRELASALDALAAGIDLVWLGWPDCGLPPATDVEARDRVSAALPQGALVVAAWGGDPHVDHQDGARLLACVARHRPDLRFLWYPIWGRFANAPGVPTVTVLDASPGARRAKRRALACHATQMTRLIDDDPEGFVMDPATQEHFLTHPEIFVAD